MTKTAHAFFQAQMLSSSDAEYMLKQALMGKALSLVAKPLAKMTGGQIAHGFGWASNKLGRGIQALAKPSVGAGQVVAQPAAQAAGAVAKTPFSQRMIDFGQRGMDVGTKHMNEAVSTMRSVGTQPGATGLQRFGGRALRVAGGATKYRDAGGLKGFAAGAVSIPGAVTYGYMPGMPSALSGGLTPGSQALSAVAGAPEFLANQQRRGAARAAAQFADTPMLQRLGAAFSPGSMGSTMQTADPQMYKYYQQYRRS